jgi:hypothetical protein
VLIWQLVVPALTAGADVPTARAVANRTTANITRIERLTACSPSVRPCQLRHCGHRPDRPGTEADGEIPVHSRSCPRSRLDPLRGTEVAEGSQLAVPLTRRIATAGAAHRRGRPARVTSPDVDVRREVDAYRHQVGAEPTDGRGVAGSAKAVQPFVWVVIGNDFGQAVTPVATNTHPHRRIRLKVSDVPGMAPVLCDDPTRAVVQMNAHHGAPAPSGTPAARLDQGMAGQHTDPGQELHRWIQEVPLEQDDTSPPCDLPRAGHAASLSARRSSPLRVHQYGRRGVAQESRNRSSDTPVGVGTASSRSTPQEATSARVCSAARARRPASTSGCHAKGLCSSRSMNSLRD